MDQVETKNVAKTLNWIGKALFWLAGVGLFIAVLSLGSKSTLVLLFGPSVILLLFGCFFRGMAAIIFNQVKNNELLEAMWNKE